MLTFRTPTLMVYDYCLWSRALSSELCCVRRKSACLSSRAKRLFQHFSDLKDMIWKGWSKEEASGFHYSTDLLPLPSQHQLVVSPSSEHTFLSDDGKLNFSTFSRIISFFFTSNKPWEETSVLFSTSSCEQAETESSSILVKALHVLA